MDYNHLANINEWINGEIPYSENVPSVTNILSEARNGGKCRDYAKWKASTILMSGKVPRNSLKVLYGLYNGQPHSVLAVYPEDGSDPYILDNYEQSVKPLSERPMLKNFESMPLPDNWK